MKDRKQPTNEESRPELRAHTRFWPGLLGAGLSVVFIAVALALPPLSGGPCRESYPMQCPVVAVNPGGLAATGVGAFASVLLLIITNASDTARVRFSGVVVGFVLLAIVLIVGANVAFAHSIEVRY